VRGVLPDGHLLAVKLLLIKGVLPVAAESPRGANRRKRGHRYMRAHRTTNDRVTAKASRQPGD